MVKQSPSQKRVYNFIVKFRQEHQTLPTIREIQNGMGYKTYKGAKNHVDSLLKKGWLEESEAVIGYKIKSIEDA